MCLRNVNGGKTNPQLPLRDLKIAEIKRIFSVDFVQQLKRIYLCGNYGDPMMARDTLPTFSYFRSTQPNLILEIFSNGSGRTVDWWSQLAQLNVIAHFGIDGIGDVNAIYRRNTDFDAIIRNASAFIAAGGKAHWDFLVFRHNEHQIDAARALSIKLGFQSFRVKKTGRFFSNAQSHVKDRQEVKDELGNMEYYLEKPQDPELINASLKKEAGLAENGSFDAYFDRTPISCKVAKENSLYVSAEGLLFPCCWTANQLYPWYQKPNRSQIWRLFEELPDGIDSINALKIPAQEIVDGVFFQKMIPDRWHRASLQEGKLKVCAKTCGREFDSFKDQFERPKNIINSLSF